MGVGIGLGGHSPGAGLGPGTTKHRQELGLHSAPFLRFGIVPYNGKCATTFSLKSFIFSPPRRMFVSQEPQVSVCFSLAYPQEWEILYLLLTFKHIAVMYNRLTGCKKTEETMKDDLRSMGFATRAIHGGQSPNAAGALVTPIYQASTFRFDSAEQGARRFALEEDGYIYTRLGNPNSAELERKVAMLEGAEAAVAAGSGMGAITSALWTALEPGDHVVAGKALYGCTFAFLNTAQPSTASKLPSWTPAASKK